ncbi:MAG: hypothetical protein A2089_14555 [Elusimicrobia bacterium GWD2_63_28]|nr:MAG: hypothetical protein A2089_14555 [Elusimicrobia bacterium GWD2_63_28]
MGMEGEEKKAGWKIWVYLTPVYILIAMPLVKWTMKINSSDVPLDAGEVNVFNASEGEIKKRQVQQGYDPNLTDLGYTVRYRADGTPEDNNRAAAGENSGRGSETAERQAQAAAQRQAQARQTSGAGINQGPGQVDAKQAKMQEGMGAQKGHLTYAVGKVANSPKAVGALLNNKYIVEGFMSRPTVKAAMGSPQGLANFLKGPGPANFMNNPVVKAALNNPAVVSAVASSGMVSAMLNTPAAQAMMRDPDALAGLIDSNPQLVQLAMQNPQTLSLLMSNPEVSGLIGKFDTSKVKSY